MRKLNTIWLSCIVLILACNDVSMHAQEKALKDSIQNELAFRDTLRDVFRTIYKNTLFTNIANGDTASIDTLELKIVDIYKKSDSSSYHFLGWYKDERYTPIEEFCTCTGIGLINRKISYLDCGSWRLSTFENADTARAFFMERLKDRPDLQKLLR